MTLHPGAWVLPSGFLFIRRVVQRWLGAGSSLRSRGLLLGRAFAGLSCGCGVIGMASPAWLPCGGCAYPVRVLCSRKKWGRPVGLPGLPGAYLHTGPWGRLITPAGFPRSTVLLPATRRPRSGRTGLSPGSGYSRVLPGSPCRSSRSSPGCRVTP